VLGPSDSLVANFVLYEWNGTTSKLLDTTYGNGPELFAKQLLPGLQTALYGQKIGSRVLAVLPPKDAYGSSGNSQAGVGPDDTLVFVIDMIAAYPGTASATGTWASHGGGALPAVTPAAGRAPMVSVPATSPPGSLVARTLINGSGPPVTSGQTVIVQYVGLIWRTGATFGSSWSRKEPFSFQIGVKPSQVITGWNTGLLGAAVGSRMLLVVPPADAYGSAGQSSAGIEAGDTLVFVVDILGVFNTAPA
jgi:peptidylprolyl isomerase